MFNTMLDINVQSLLVIIFYYYYNSIWIKMFYLKHNKLCRFKWKVLSLAEGIWQSIGSSIRDMKMEDCKLEERFSSGQMLAEHASVQKRRERLKCKTGWKME